MYIIVSIEGSRRAIGPTVARFGSASTGSGHPLLELTRFFTLAAGAPSLPIARPVIPTDEEMPLQPDLRALGSRLSLTV